MHNINIATSLHPGVSTMWMNLYDYNKKMARRVTARYLPVQLHNNGFLGKYGTIFAVSAQKTNASGYYDDDPCLHHSQHTAGCRN